MKKILISICVALITVLCLAGCDFGNWDMIDTNYTYDKAIIALPTGETIEIDIKQWSDYTDGEQIQIISTDGTIYLTSSYNCTLIRK